MMENINNRLIKDTFFLFERLGFEVYLDSHNDPVLLLSLPRCNKCGNPWYFNISQCFFCGAIAPFIMKDNKNNKYISPTNASANRFYPCINPDCLSNKNDQVSDMIKSKYKGVFDRKSPFNTTLENCIKCGNDSYTYDTALIRICIVNEDFKINESNEYDGNIIRFYKKKKIELQINNDKSLLSIFKQLENNEMDEEDFKIKIQKIIENPELFSYDNH